jgi:hypothetical protein
MICTRHQISRWPTKKYEIGGASGTYGGEERYIQGKLRETNYLVELGVDGTIIFP